MTEWTVDAAAGTATAPDVPVIADGALVATLTPMWSDVDGVRVAMTYADGTEDMNAAQATALSDALREVAGMAPPPGY